MTLEDTDFLRTITPVPSTMSLTDFPTGTSHHDAISFLSQVDATWKARTAQMLTIRQIFLYLDRTHVLSSSTRSLRDMGLQVT